MLDGSDELGGQAGGRLGGDAQSGVAEQSCLRNMKLRVYSVITCFSGARRGHMNGQKGKKAGGKM